MRHKLPQASEQIADPHWIYPREVLRIPGLTAAVDGAALKDELLRVCSACRPLLGTSGGSVVNVSSSNASVGRPGMAQYDATKGALLSLTRALAYEAMYTGVRISALCPGPTATEFGDVAGIRGSRFSSLSADARRVVEAGQAG